MFSKFVSVIISVCVISQVFSLEFSNSSNHCGLQNGLAEKMDCPNWFKPSNVKNGTSLATGCECGSDISIRKNIVLRCDKYNTEIKIYTCLTYDAAEGVSIVNNCPFNFMTPDSPSGFLVTLPNNLSQLNSRMCGPLNRDGPLCSKCKDGLGPAVLSYRMICVKCFDSGYGWIIYAAAVFFPTTFFFLIVVCFKVDVTSASMNMFILLCQIIVNIASLVPSINLNLNAMALVVLSFYGLWNLDVFRAVLPSFCISSNMTTLQVIALEYIVAIYPLLFTAIVYYCIEFHDKGNRFLMWVWKPFHKFFWCFRKTWDLKGSVINAFATFVLLSYSKIWFTSMNLLRSTQTYNGCGDVVDTVLYLDPSVTFFSRTHLPYALVAIIMAFVFVVFPLIFLLFYQNRHFHQFLACFRLKNTLLTEVTKVFQKSFKNGNNGDADYRWFAGVYVLCRTVYVVPFYLYIITVCGIAALLVALLQPYKHKFFSILDSVVIGVCAFTIVYVYFALKNNISLYPVSVPCILPLIYFILLVTYKLLKIVKTFRCCGAVIRKAKHILSRQTSNEDQHTFSYRFYHPEEYEPLSPVIADKNQNSFLPHTKEQCEEIEECNEVEQPLLHINENHKLYGTV